jgi:hypothetical protein
MSNNTTKGVKKSAFLGKTDIPAGTTFDYVLNGVNYKITGDDLIGNLGATGTLVQAGPASGASPVLDVSGTVNRIRNITNGFGISASINAENGITFATNFSYNNTGARLVDDASAPAAVYRSIVGGSGIDVVGSTGLITLSVTSGTNIVVSTIADFPDAAGGVITLAANISYRLVKDITTSNRFVPSNGSSLQGDSEVNSSLTYTGTGDMFTWVNADVHIEHIGLKCPNGTFFNGINTTASTYKFDMNAVEFDGKTLGAIGATKQIRMTRCDFDVATNGFVFSGDLGYVLVANGFNDLAAGTLFDLGSATMDGITFVNQVTRGAAAAKFVDGLANSGNINTNGVGVLNNCHVNGPDLAGSNINVNNSRWEFAGNDEIANTRPDGLLTLIGNSTATTISGAGTAVLVAGSWVVDSVSQSTGTTAGRYTYNGSKNAKLPVMVDLTVTPVSGAAIAMSAYIAINGSIVARSRREAPLASGGLIQVISLPWQITAESGDYVEVFVANDTSTVNLLVSSAVIRVN